jgi:hypothetical protein
MKQVIAAAVALIVLSIHLLFTILHNAPANPLTKSYQPATERYIEPYFTQRWQLFAPEPATYMLKLWYRVKVNQTWEHWTDPLAPILAKHQHNRFTYNAKLLYVYGNLARDLKYEYESIGTRLSCADTSQACTRQREDSLQQTNSYRQAVRYVIDDYQTSDRNAFQPDSIQMLVVQIYPKQYSERLSAKPFGLASSVEFRPLKYPSTVYHAAVKKM